MKEEITVSLIVSTYNWPEALNLCLESILKQTVQPSEILIADDGSTEATKKIIQQFSLLSQVPVIHVWHEDKGFRLAAIRNKAILQSSKKYIIQIDGDVLISSHFIEDHLYMAEKGCFVRGTRVNLSKRETKTLCETGQIPSTGKLHFTIKQPINAFRLPLYISRFITRKEMSGERVKGCNMAFWREDLIKVNGFSNDFKGWGHEDVELATRLVNSGITKKIIKFSAIVYHLYHGFLSRDNTDNNTQELLNTNKNSLTWAKNGLNEVNNEE
ncbi:MAG: glycosyltransferase family 2 protein [Bacteroidaceae bacterium]